MKRIMIWTIAILLLLPASAFVAVCGYGLWGAKGFSFDKCRGLVVVAHRGGGVNVPENSLAAVEAGISSRADVVEIDVRMSSDGELVVCHDATVDRTTNGVGRVADMTFEELRRLRLKATDGTLTDECIPTLGDVLALVNGRCRLLIEVKRGISPESVAKALINEIAAYGASGWVSVQSFDDAVLSEIHRLGHPFPLEKLFVFKIPGLPLAYDGSIVSYNYSKYDYISSFNFCAKAVSPSLVRDVHSRGKHVKVWTVGAPCDTPALPVDGVITDSPSLWRR